MTSTTPSTSSAAAPPGSISVEQWTETFVDRSRPTEAGAETPEMPERTLEIDIYLPEAPGPAPLIVFAHGLNGHPDKFTGLLRAWAEAGYVVAAPAFPTTNDKVPGAGQNYPTSSGQPADVSFVLDQLLAGDADPESPLHERIDEARIGVGGMSLGGATTYGVVFSQCCRDVRVGSAMVLAGATLPLAGDVDLDGSVPLLIVHGEDDPALGLSLAEDAFARSASSTWFVTLLGAGHAEPFEDAISPHDRLVAEVTTHWWLATLGDDPSALPRLEDVVATDPLSTLQVRD
jgi:predicted dienelactone hydrolase